MPAHRNSSTLALAAIALLLGACSQEAAPPAAPQGAAASPTGGSADAGDSEAAPAAEGDIPMLRSAHGRAELPAGHPPVDGSAAPQPEMPPGHPPPATADGASVAPPAGASGTGAAALRWDAPAAWVSEPPANAMRKAQYRVPGPAGEATCIVYYFGPGQGGEPQANAERWASQFAQPDGTPATQAMKTDRLAVDGISVLLVETTGTYQASMMEGGSGQPAPGWALLGAIAEGPDAHWFFKLTGPAKTVAAQRDAFLGMVRSLSRGA